MSDASEKFYKSGLCNALIISSIIMFLFLLKDIFGIKTNAFSLIAISFMGLITGHKIIRRLIAMDVNYGDSTGFLVKLLVASTASYYIFSPLHSFEFNYQLVKLIYETTPTLCLVYFIAILGSQRMFLVATEPKKYKMFTKDLFSKLLFDGIIAAAIIKSLIGNFGDATFKLVTEHYSHLYNSFIVFAVSLLIIMVIINIFRMSDYAAKMAKDKSKPAE